jgi:hypothetical protein
MVLDNRKLYSLVCLLICQLFSLRLNAQTDADSFLVEGKDFKGYIMPIPSSMNFPCEKPQSEFRPSRMDVIHAEEVLDTYLNKRPCWVPGNYANDCRIIRSELPDYFRQYIGYIDTLSGHRLMYALFASKEVQATIEEMKSNWMDWFFNVNDGGPILFHAYIDLDTREVIHFHDNGGA